MALRHIVTQEDKILHKVCREQVKFDERLHQLLDDMAETLENANGVGLAAPQVGILRRVVLVIETNVEDDEDEEHEHHHHHDHDADEVFTSWGTETVKAYSEAELEHILTALDSGEYGAILRAKGIVAAADGGQWLHYDFVPEEHQVRRGPADYTGRICVIGSQLKEDKLSQLFGL